MRIAEPLASLRGARWTRPAAGARARLRALVAAVHDAHRGLRGRRRRARGRRPLNERSRPMAREVVRGSVHDLVHHDPDARRPRGVRRPRSRSWNPRPVPSRGHDRRRHAVRREVLVGPRGIGSRGKAGLPAVRARTRMADGPGRCSTGDRDGAARRGAPLPGPDEVDEVRIAFRAPTVLDWAGRAPAWRPVRRHGGTRLQPKARSSRTLAHQPLDRGRARADGVRSRCTTGAEDSALRTCCASEDAAMPGIRIPTAADGGPARARDGFRSGQAIGGGASRAASKPGRESATRGIRLVVIVYADSPWSAASRHR